MSDHNTNTNEESPESLHDDEVIDAYLWDGTGPVDETVESLESLLSVYRHEPSAQAFEAPVERGGWGRGLLVAAAVLLVVSGVWLLMSREDAPSPSPPERSPEVAVEGWRVHGVTGQTRCGGASEGCAGTLAAGQWLETGADGGAVLDVADIGEMTLSPHTRLQLRSTGTDEHRLHLAQGEVHARVNALPRLFVVETPYATAVDLGCEYTLTVSSDGVSRLEVLSGAVALALPDREVYVPAGGIAEARPGEGLGTPWLATSSDAVIDALRAYDRAPSEVTLEAALSRAEATDTLSLWHLLQSAPGARGRLRVIGALQSRRPFMRLDQGGLMRLDAAALEALRKQLEPEWR